MLHVGHCGCIILFILQEGKSETPHRTTTRYLLLALSEKLDIVTIEFLTFMLKMPSATDH